MFLYIRRRRSNRGNNSEEEWEDDFDIQKVHKSTGKEVELVNSPMSRGGNPDSKMKKKKKRVVDEDASLEQYYKDKGDAEEIKMQFNLPAAFTSNRFATNNNKQHSVNTFGVYELSKAESMKKATTSEVEKNKNNSNSKAGKKKKKRAPPRDQIYEEASESEQSASSQASSLQKKKVSSARMLKMGNPMNGKKDKHRKVVRLSDNSDSEVSADSTASMTARSSTQIRPLSEVMKLSHSTQQQQRKGNPRPIPRRHEIPDKERTSDVSSDDLSGSESD